MPVNPFIFSQGRRVNSQDNMNNNNNNNKSEYISLREATRHCSYSQDYLKLRARQGKLKAIKVARNWLTKKEWIDEYLEETNNYKNQIAEQRKKKEQEFEKIEEIKKAEKEITKPTPIFAPRPSFQLVPRVRFIAFVAALVFVFVGTIFAYPYLQPVGSLISQTAKEITSNIGEGIIETGDNLESGSAFIGKGVNKLFKDFRQYITQDVRAIKKFFSKISRTVLETFKKVPEKIVSIFKEKKIEIPEEILTQQEIEKLIAEKSVSQEELFQLQQIIEKLKQEGLPVREIIKEVTQITQIQPVTEITKKVIDDESLTKLSKQIADIEEWETDILTLQTLTSKLQTHPPYTQVTTAPVYIGSQGLQIGGAATFASLGVSGSAGITNLGVGDSTSLGSDSSDKLTVNATANFLSSATFASNLTIGTGTTTLTLDSSGNITSGIWQGTAIATQYGGTGQDWSSVATGSLPYFSDTGVLTTLAPTTTGYFLKTQGAGQPLTWAEVIQVWEDSGSALYPTNLTRKVGVGTSTPAYSLHVWGSAAFGTSTTPALYIDSGSGRVGIGTSNPATTLDVVGNIIQPTSAYLSYGSTVGSSGYGIRDYAGTMQYKNEAGDWADIASTAASAGGWTDDGTVVRLTTGTDRVGIGTTTPTGIFEVATSTGATYFYVGTDGNVGIGTSNPATTLDVVGNIIQPASAYLSYGSTVGSSGYGIRDYAGTMQYKNEAGDWADIASTAASAGGWTDDGTVVRLTTGTDRVGIGTTTPTGIFEVATSTGATVFRIDQSGNITTGDWRATLITTQYGGTGQDWSSIATGSLPYFLDTGVLTTLAPTTSGFLKTQGLGQPLTWAEVIQVWEDSGTALYPTTLSRYVGVGTTSPITLFQVVGTTTLQHILPQSDAFYSLGSASQRWANLYAATTTIGGTIIIGTDTITATSALTVSTGASSDLILTPGAGGSVGIGTTTPTGILSVATSTGASYFYVGTDGNIGIGTINPGAKLHSLAADEQLRLGYNASNYVSFTVGSTSTLTIQTATSANIILDTRATTTAVKIGPAGTGKLDAGTVDPKYNIGGTRYATYMASMAGGVKEEVVGVVKLQESSNPLLFIYIIDFNNLEEGSDLWLFSRIVDWGEDMENLVVLLSSEESGEVSYQKDPPNDRLIIYGDSACEVSYRFTASRFDYYEWPNLVREEDQSGGFTVPEFLLRLDSDGSAEVNLDNLADSLSGRDTSGLSSDGGFIDDFRTSFLNILASFGGMIRDGVLAFSHLIVDHLVVEELQVKEVTIEDSMILRSPGGLCFQVKVSDDGELILTQVDCPGGPELAVVSENLTPTPVPASTPSTQQEPEVLSGENESSVDSQHPTSTDSEMISESPEEEVSQSSDSFSEEPLADNSNLNPENATSSESEIEPEAQGGEEPPSLDLPPEEPVDNESSGQSE